MLYVEKLCQSNIVGEPIVSIHCALKDLVCFGYHPQNEGKFLGGFPRMYIRLIKDDHN